MEVACPAPPRPPTHLVLNQNLQLLAGGSAIGIDVTALLGPRLVRTHDWIWHAQRCVWGVHLTRLHFGSMAPVFLPNLRIPLAPFLSFRSRKR
jgi:hypothetical protein